MAKRENPRPGVAMGRGVGIAAGHGANDSITAPPEEPQRDRARALLTALRLEYPVLGEYRPLSIGIRTVLHAVLPGETHNKTINRVLAMHCRSDRYLRALAAGGLRYALDGTPSGEVSEEHRAAAALLLARRAQRSKVQPPAPRRPVLSLDKSRRRP